MDMPTFDKLTRDLPNLVKEQCCEGCTCKSEQDHLSDNQLSLDFKEIGFKYSGT